MHRLKAHLFLLLCIGMFSLGLKADEPTDEQLDEMQKKHLVYVEPRDEVKLHTDEEGQPLKPYKERQNRWGFMFGVGYASYQPKNYLPQLETDGSYSDWYGSPSMPNIEVHLQPKRNLGFGSVGLDVAGFMFKSSASDGSNLALEFVQLGLVFNADALFSKIPYVVPYAEAGIYSVFYNESNTGQTTFKGDALAAGFLAAGLNLQLDWIDPDSAAITYRQTSLKSFFLFAELRDYMSSFKSSDPNFSGVFWDAGLRAEF